MIVSDRQGGRHQRSCGDPFERQLYEYGKDVVTYAILSASTIAFAQFLVRREEEKPPEPPPSPPAEPLIAKGIIVRRSLFLKQD